MRKYVTGVVSTLVALTGLTLFAASPFEALKVHLTETTHVAQTELPAGDYTLRYLNVGSDSPFITFQSAKGGTVIIQVMRNQIEKFGKAENSQLVFTKTSDGLKLDRIEIEGSTYSYDIVNYPNAPTHTMNQ